MEPPRETRETIRTKRTVIDEHLIREAVIADRKYNLDETIADLKVEETMVDPDEIKILILTHKNIFRISNLEGYDHLRKLVLNSNNIRKIEGLNHLVNLEWLDLSFNQISKIEGIDKLVNLKDLSLHKNQISKIEGIENLERLEILSLGENNISDMTAIQSLRPHKNLKVLCLRGNPVSRKDNYVSNIIAFLPHVQFLDYKLLQPTAQQRDFYPSELDDLLKEEKKKSEEEKVLIEQQKAAKEDDAMNVSGLNSMYEDMLNEDKSYNETISKFSRFTGFKQEVMAKYEREFKKEVALYLSQCKTIHKHKCEHEEKFKQAVEETDKKSKSIAVALIKEFEKKKIDILKRYEEGKEDRLEYLSEELKTLEKKLMENEILLVEQLADHFNTIKDLRRKSKDQSSSLRSEFLLKVSDVVSGYQTKVLEFFERERERLKDEEEEDEDEDEDEDEIVVLVKNEDKLKDAINRSYESQKEFIEELIAQHTKEEEIRIKAMTTQLTLENYTKNRNRVAEIFDVVALYKKVIEMNQEEDEDEDEDFETFES